MLYQWLLFTIKLIHLLLPFAAAVQNKTSNNTQQQQQQQPEYIYGCFDKSSVPLSTTNQINLNNLISSLTSDAATSNGFGHTTSGSSNADQNMFYGLYVCRGDVNKPLCHSCIQTYSRLLMQFCPNSTSALMIYPLCGVRYSNQNFFGILTVTPRVPMFDINHNVSRAGRFDNDSRILMTRLIETGSETPLMFATHMFKKKGTQTRYGWVQCNRDITRVECRTCLSSMLQEAENCCVDKVMWRVFSPSCIMMYETQPFFLNEIETLQPTLEPHPQAKEEGNKTRSWIITVTIIAVTVIVVIALLAFGTYQFGWLNWKNDKKGMKEDGLNSIFWEDKTDDKEDTMNADLPMIPLDTILTITNNFSDEYKLGKGGFGSVYKGVLPDGRQIAIKRLAKTSVQGVKEFKNEVMLIARLQHRNLVRLLAFCIEKNEKLLVYEYMPNSSLDFHLFDREKGAELDWKQRSNIINGIAKGLLYLHEDSRLRIIHRDLKAGNVLLDQEMNPKISDFGLARIFGGDQREAINTNRVVGTYGYMAPEYAMEGLFSVKSDVFSFGVLLLEIISGKRINQFNLAEHGESLLIYAWNLWCEGKGLELMDPLIEKSCVHSEVLKCMHIGLLCVQEDAAVRPTMSSVVHMLGSGNVTLPCPVRPAFSVGRVVIERALSSNNWGHSINELTISDVTPR